MRFVSDSVGILTSPRLHKVLVKKRKKKKLIFEQILFGDAIVLLFRGVLGLSCTITQVTMMIRALLREVPVA